MKQYVVYAFGWDIFPRPKTKIAAAESLGAVLPRDIEFLHVGIGVYNRLYHFVQDGIQVKFTMPANYKVLRGGDWETNYELTEVKMEELDKWLSNVARQNFSETSYHVTNNNCICFAKALCEFLKVRFEGKQTKLQMWLQTATVASEFVEKIRTNPIMGLLSAVSNYKVQKKCVEKIDVGAIIGIEIQNVDEALETQFRITNSGSIYDITDASTIVE